MDWNAPTPDVPARSSREPGLREPVARSPYLGAVRDAWRRAWEAGDLYANGLALALCLFARDGRARGVPVHALLQTLDGLIRASGSGDPAELGEIAELEQARSWAGAQVIRAYHGAD